MGRPPEDLIRFHVSITTQAFERLNKICRPKERSEFIREAIDRRLDDVEAAQKAAADGKKPSG